MKKIISLIFAVVSTTFLFVGATQAAEKFDGLAKLAVPAVAGSAESLALPPCVIDPEQEN